MKKNEKILVLSILMLLGAHFIGIIFSLYSSIKGYDILVHFLGGFFVAQIPLYFFIDPRKKWEIINKRTTLSFILGFVLIVGIGWEIFEFLWSKFFYNTFQVQLLLQPSKFDTIKDIVVNLIGGSAFWQLNKKAKLTRQTTETASN